MTNLLSVPAASRGGKQEDHTKPMKNGNVDKHPGSGGYKTIGSASEGTTDGGQKADLARAYPRQAARQAAHQARRGK